MHETASVSTAAQAARRAKVTRVQAAQWRSRRQGEPCLSERAFARHRSIPRSTLRDALEDNDNDRDPVADFFRSEPGAPLFHRVLFAIIVVFLLAGAGSLRQLDAFLRLCGLQRFVAPCPSSLNTV